MQKSSIMYHRKNSVVKWSQFHTSAIFRLDFTHTTSATSAIFLCKKRKKKVVSSFNSKVVVPQTFLDSGFAHYFGPKGDFLLSFLWKRNICCSAHLVTNQFWRSFYRNRLENHRKYRFSMSRISNFLSFLPIVNLIIN